MSHIASHRITTVSKSDTPFQERSALINDEKFIRIKQSFKRHNFGLYVCEVRRRLTLKRQQQRQAHYDLKYKQRHTPIQILHYKYYNFKQILQERYSLT